MDEDIKTLIAALDRVAFSDARIRNLAARRRIGQFQGIGQSQGTARSQAWSVPQADMDPAGRPRQPEETGA